MLRHSRLASLVEPARRPAHLDGERRCDARILTLVLTLPVISRRCGAFGFRPRIEYSGLRGSRGSKRHLL